MLATHNALSRSRWARPPTPVVNRRCSRSLWTTRNRHGVKITVAAPQRTTLEPGGLDAGEDTTVLGNLHVDVVHTMGSEVEDDKFEPLTSMWARNAEQHGDYTAVMDPHRSPAVSLTYREVHKLIMEFAAGLKSLGVQPADRVCLFSENSSRWIIADQAIMINGAADAVRGATSPVDELSYILTQSGSSGLIVQDKATLRRLLPALSPGSTPPALKFVVVLWDDATDSSAESEKSAMLDQAGVAVLSYDQVLTKGRSLLSMGSLQPHKSRKHDLATIVYTSGTTGHPKGVMLSHGNLMSQISNFDYFLKVQPGDSTLSLLPPWHIYQRTVAYFLFKCGAKEVFTNIRKFRDDLGRYPPDHFVCVPLVLDTLYNKACVTWTHCVL
eukprot:jgi/Chrzof1/13719/Cz08g09130.t1